MYQYSASSQINLGEASPKWKLSPGPNLNFMGRVKGNPKLRRIPAIFHGEPAHFFSRSKACCTETLKARAISSEKKNLSLFLGERESTYKGETTLIHHLMCSPRPKSAHYLSLPHRIVTLKNNLPLSLQRWQLKTPQNSLCVYV